MEVETTTTLGLTLTAAGLEETAVRLEQRGTKRKSAPPARTPSPSAPDRSLASSNSTRCSAWTQRRNAVDTNNARKSVAQQRVREGAIVLPFPIPPDALLSRKLEALTSMLVRLEGWARPLQHQEYVDVMRDGKVYQIFGCGFRLALNLDNQPPLAAQFSVLSLCVTSIGESADSVELACRKNIVSSLQLTLWKALCCGRSERWATTGGTYPRARNFINAVFDDVSHRVISGEYAASEGMIKVLMALETVLGRLTVVC